MEELLLKMLPGLGSGGIVAYVLYMVARRYFEDAKQERALLEKTRAESAAQMTARIGALEAHVVRCDEDRAKLWERLVTPKTVTTSNQ